MRNRQRFQRMPWVLRGLFWFAVTIVLTALGIVIENRLLSIACFAAMIFFALPRMLASAMTDKALYEANKNVR